MPTAVLDLDLEQLPSFVQVDERYQHVLILFRLRGQPVGCARLPLVNSHVSGADLRDAAVEATVEVATNFLLDGYVGVDLNLEANPPDATVAVCTRERPSDLRRCLDALMELPDDGQEFIVIDNCPTSDMTLKLVTQYARVRYILEPRRGLDVARNRALREARNDIVAFIDDDAVADSMWLRMLLKNFSDPTVLCVTGLTMPLELETHAQELFEAYGSFSKGFRRTVFRGGHGNPLNVGHVGAGANMALRTTLLEEVGPFDEALDAGTLTQSGGDHEMFSRILAEGLSIVYDPAALNWHRHRRTYAELRAALSGYGTGVYARWTRSLLIDHESEVIRLALNWMRYDQMPALTRSILRRPDARPLSLVWAELTGCIAGPRAYLTERGNAARASGQ